MSESRYAVLIGNSDFPHEPKLASLRCPGNDVDGLSEILGSSSYGGFDSIVVPKNAPHNQALLRMHEVFNQAEKDDLVLIYYSGHGKQDMEGQLYLASADTLMSSLTVTSIPVEVIRRIIRNSRTNKIVLILDCCYSGAVSGAFLRSDVDTELERISRTARGTYILTASTSLQTAVEREGDQYGLLTKHILEGIQSGDAARDDGLVTMDTLYNYVYDKITSESPQEPMKYELNVRGSDLIISRTERISREEWRKRVRRKIYELDLPSRIEAVILHVVGLNLNQLSRKQACYNELLDQLLKDQLTVPEFIDQWYVTGERIDRIYDLYHRAQSAMYYEAWNDAIAYWEQLVELDPDNKEVSAKLQQAELKKQELAERIRSIDSQVQEATDQGNWNEVIFQLGALIKLQPGNKEAMSALTEAQDNALRARITDIYHAAEGATDREDWDDAISHWQALLQLDPNHAEAKTKLSDARLKKQELAERIKNLYLRVHAATELRDWNEAVVQWQALIELQPGHQEAISALAEAQFKQQKIEAEIAVIRSNAQSAMDSEDCEEAINHWQALLQLDSTDDEARTKLEEAQLKKQELVDRIKSLYRRARAATEQKDWNEAVVQWLALVGLKPGDREATDALAEARLEQKNIVARSAVVYDAAEGAMQREDWDDAIGHWQALLQLDSTDDEAKNRLKEAQLKKQELAERIKNIYRRAQAATERRDWNEAIGQWQDLIKLEPGNNEAINALAESLRQKDLLTSIARHHRAAQIAMEWENWDYAIGRWQAVLQLDPNHEEARTKLEEAQLKKRAAQSAPAKNSNTQDQPPETPPAVESPPQRETQTTPEVEAYEIRTQPGHEIAELTQPIRITVAVTTSPDAKPDHPGSSPVQDPTYLARLRSGLKIKKCPKCGRPFAARYSFCHLDGAPLVSRFSGAEYLSRQLARMDALVVQLRKEPRRVPGVFLVGILLLSIILIFMGIWYYRNKTNTRVDPPAVKEEQKTSTPAGPALSSFSFKTFLVDPNGQPTETQVEKTAQGFSLKLSDDVYLEMVYIPGGKFTIGSSGKEMGEERFWETNGPEITVKPFYLGKYEVTRDEWAAVAKLPQINQALDLQPSKAPVKDQAANRLPVDTVNWSEAIEFAGRISSNDLKCTLPSEAEWEYACRAGTISPFAFPMSAAIGNSINYNGTERRTAHPTTHPATNTTQAVDSFKLANNFGLFAMHGNLWEWCMDIYHEDYRGIPTDATPWTTGEGNRVVRGGAWASPLIASRSATRWSQHEKHKGIALGFRVACYVRSHPRYN